MSTQATTEALLAEASVEHAGHGMICLRPSQEVREVFYDMAECDEPLDDLHVTLYYLGEIDPGDLATKERYHRGLYDFVLHAGYRGLEGKVNGYGVFLNEQNSLVALWDIPGIAEFRANLVSYLRTHAPDLRRDDHGFTPHMTLKNTDESIRTLPKLPRSNPDKVIFGSLWLVWGEDWTEVTLL